jgi:hypothetical protein
MLLVPSGTVHAFVPTAKSSVNIRTFYQQHQRISSLQALDGSSNAGSAASMPSLDVLNGLDPMILGGGAVGILVLAAVAAAAGSPTSERGTGSGKSSSSNTQKQLVEVQAEELVDLSIPYNAAALLAYQQVYANGQETDTEFVTFEQMYKEMAVAQVILKRKQQQVEALEQAFTAKYPAAAVVNGVVQETQTA